MKKTLLALLFATLAIPFNAFTVSAEEPISVEQLKEQIAKLEMIARDENHSTEVKELNKRFLSERRIHLRSLLEKRVNSLTEYLRTVGSSLSVNEIETVEQSISNLNAEIEGLRGDRVVTKPAETHSSQEYRARVVTPAYNTLPVSMVTDASPAPMPAQSEDKEIRGLNPAKEIPETAKPYLRLPTAVIINSENAELLIREAFRAGAFADARGTVIRNPYQDNRGEFKQEELKDEDPLPDDFHCIIHVLRWNDPAKAKNETGDEKSAQTIAAQNWYVYNNGQAKGLRSDRIWSKEDLATTNRIYGVKRVWLLYVHLNKWRTEGYTAQYDFNVVKRIPANIANLLAIAKLFGAFTTPTNADLSPQQDIWGGSFVNTHYVPSDVTVTANIIKDPRNGPIVSLDKPKKYDNEGLYWWDLSVGVPIRRIKQLEFDTTANTVAAKEVDKQNAFALINIYAPPKDITGTGFSWIPHFVGGVAIAKQPLKKFMVGAGFGPHFANFYLGALFTEVKEPATLKAGDMATPDQLNTDLRKHFKSQFTFGINIPVRAVLKTLDKDKK